MFQSLLKSSNARQFYMSNLRTRLLDDTDGVVLDIGSISFEKEGSTLTCSDRPVDEVFAPTYPSKSHAKEARRAETFEEQLKRLEREKRARRLFVSEKCANHGQGNVTE